MIAELLYDTLALPRNSDASPAATFTATLTSTPSHPASWPRDALPVAPIPDSSATTLHFLPRAIHRAAGPRPFHLRHGLRVPARLRPASAAWRRIPPAVLRRSRPERKLGSPGMLSSVVFTRSRVSPNEPQCPVASVLVLKRVECVQVVYSSIVCEDV